MGLPARNDDYIHPEIEPDIKPHLGVIQGGGESSAPRRGHLQAVDGNQTYPSDPETAEKENNPSSEMPSNDTQSSETAALAQNDAADQVGSGVDVDAALEKKKKKGPGVLAKFTNMPARRRAWIGGIVAGLVVGGGTFGTFVVPMLTPLHWLHYAQGLHILDESSDETNNLSITKLYRYYKTRNFNRTRLTFLQNRDYDKLTARLADEGVHILNRANGRSSNVLEFDVDKVFPEYKNLSYDDTTKAMQKRFGKGLSVNRVNDITTGETKTLRVSIRNASARTANKVLNTAVDQVGDDSFMSSLGRRRLKWFLSRNFDVADLFHPSRRVSRAWQNAIDKIFPASARAKTAISQTKSAWEEWKASESAKGVFKGIGAAVIAQMGICAVRDTASKVTETEHAAIVVPGQVYAIQTIAYAGQIEASSPDITAGSLTTATSSLYADGKTPMDAASFKAAQGETVNGAYTGETATLVDRIKSAFSKDSVDKQVVNAIDHIYVSPNVTICSPGGIAIGTALGIGALLASIPTTGGAGAFAVELGTKVVLTAAAGVAIGALLSAGEQQMASWISGTVPQLVNSGVVGGELTVQSMKYINDSMSAADGGVKPSPNALKMIESSIAEKNADKAANQSMYARLLDPKNGSSLVGKAVDHVSPSTTDNLSNVASALTSIGQAIANLPFAIVGRNSVAHAAANDISVSAYDPLLALGDSDNADVVGDNEEAVAALYDGSQGQYYRDKVLECTGNEISWNDTDGYWDVDAISQVDTTSVAWQNDCYNNTTLSGDANWSKIMASINLTNNAERLSCAKINRDDSCDKIAMGATVGAYSTYSDAIASTDAVGPATLDRAQGKWGGYSNGEIPTTAMTKINSQDFPGNSAAVCNHPDIKTVPSLPYFNPSAYVSLKALNDAYMNEHGGTGLLLESCYRDLKGQQTAKDSQKGNAATVGTSNHGWGLAVDFDNMNSYSDSKYRWLMENGPKYGWVNPPNMQEGGSGPNEPWHWEYARPIGSSV